MTPKQIHTGFHARRLSDSGPASVSEKVFAEQWQQQESDLLEYLLGQDNHKGEVSERDARVAATVIQWLGSGCGQQFLEKVSSEIALQQARCCADRSQRRPPVMLSWFAHLKSSLRWR